MTLDKAHIDNRKARESEQASKLVRYTRKREHRVSTESSERLNLEQIEALTDTDQKTLRAYLRRNFKRSSERKGSRWGDAKQNYILNKAQTKALVEHFLTVDDEQEEQAS